MVNPDRTPSSNDPFRPRPAKKNSDNLDGVIDELRQVLAGMTNKTDNGENGAAAQSQPSEEPPVEESSETADAEASLTEEFFRTSPAPEPVAEPGAPGADFWSGNVLGWPSEPPPVETKNNGPAEPFRLPAEDLPMSGSDASAPPVPPVPVEPSPEDWMKFQSKESAETISKLRPDGVAPAEPSTATPPVTNLPPEPPPMEIPVEPPPPPPPTRRLIDTDVHELRDQFPVPPAKNPMKEDAMKELFLSPLEEELPPAAPPTSSPDKTPATDDLPLSAPVPKNFEATDNPALHLDSTNVKPDHIYHVACVFPEGEEKRGQLFIANLKTAAKNGPEPINVQAVFIHPWGVGSVDLAAMAKSAMLAGAEMMYILSPLRDKERFKRHAEETLSSGVRSRMILIERVPLRALYADVILDLRRRDK